jgi:AraC-like DNA-binding protein
MIFEFIPGPDFNFLTSFAEKMGVPVHGNTLHIPAALGEGIIRIIDQSPDFKLLVHRYTLKEEFVLRRMAPKVVSDLVSILFHSNEEKVNMDTPGSSLQFSKNTEYAIQISSNDLDSEIRFPAHTGIYFTVVGLASQRLRHLLNIKQPNGVISTILSGLPGFLYYESMTPDVLKTLKQITDAGEEDELVSLFYRIKVQELIYFLFDRLQKRDSLGHSPINKADADKLFLIRTVLLSDLSKPPRLPELARMAGISLTKMKDLFKQVFGDSIYTHFQKARMEEAAFMVKQAHYSVSEVGFQLGFSNLSHFSRLFEKHYGITPKKYASG